MEKVADFDNLFPGSPRVIYKKSTLAQVICQLRYPAILRIEKEVPVDFQESVRSLFPFFEKQEQRILDIVNPDLIQNFGAIAGSTYIFRSEDKSAELHLSHGSLSLTVTSYSRWEDFKGLLKEPLSSLMAIYKPSFFERIGLRYVNVIDKAAFGLEERSWSALLGNKILGELADQEFENNAEEARRLLRVRGNQLSFLLQHGLVPNNTSTYLIDFDFYNDKRTECTNANSTLDALNRYAGRAFRWCVTPELHAAMEPIELDRDGHSKPAR